MVDMTPGAITDRLLALSRALSARGFVEKGVDMSPQALRDRLRTLAALSDMCWRLAKIAEALPLQSRPP